MEEEQQEKAVQAIAAMYLTREEIQTSLKLLDPFFGEVLQGGEAEDLQKQVEARAQEVMAELMARAKAEMEALPPEAQAKLNAERSGWEPSSTEQEPGAAGVSPLADLVRGEYNLERYIVKKVAPLFKSQVEVGANVGITFPFS
jgi:hypothetical protein